MRCNLSGGVAACMMAVAILTVVAVITVFAGITAAFVYSAFTGLPLF